MGNKLKLFDDDGVENDVDKISNVEINKDFAKRYEHNKKREDLQRLQELKKKGVIDDSDDESSDTSSSTSLDEEDIKSKKKDLEFFDALLKVRNQDPLLKDKEAKLFNSESENEEDNQTDNDNDNQRDDGGKKERKNKQKMYLKDVTSRHLIEKGPEVESDSEDDDEDDEEEAERRVKSYSEEQDELRKEFLRAVEEAEWKKSNEGNEDGEELLKLKERRGRDEESEDEDDGVFGEKLDEYFGKDGKLDENEMFLKDYFRKRLWEDNKVDIGSDDESLGFSDDEEEIERQEDYEREFNFRFEENAGDRVMGHPRKVEESVRKRPNARKLQRDRKEERMAQAELERKEELKRLKNLKKKEINEKLQKIRETAGFGEDAVCRLDEYDLDDEFDPEEHDRKMKQAFDNDYYVAEDVDPEFGSDQDDDAGELEKPDFDKEDELLGLPKGWGDVNEPGDGFMKVRERILKQKAESGGNNEQAGGEEDAVPEEGKGKKKKKKTSEVEKAVREELMEEYYKLDYEDTIGDLKTRFKYKPVKAKKFGLRTEEILMMDDKELNQFVSLKKLAPYREKEWKVDHRKIEQQKERNKALLQGEPSRVSNTDRKRKRNDDPKSNAGVITSENQEQKTNDFTADTSNVSRKTKRRLNQAELKIPHKRLIAYGKIPSKPKSKK